jgi:hypothetical protein
MNKLTILITTVLMLVSGCSSVPVRDIQVQAQVDSKVNMAGYETYTWLGSAAILNDSYGQWEPLGFDADSEIKYLIDRELRKRGMSERTRNADVIVAFAAGVDMDALDINIAPEGEIDIENVPRGGLVVILMDSQTQQAIWMGVATGEIQDRPEKETAKARLDYAVTRILRLLPD